MKIQLKRSDRLENDVAKQPTPAQMEYGELAVNFNFSDPSIFIKDNANNIIKIAGNDAFGTANTLQEVTDQGNYTNKDIEIGGVPTVNGGTPNIDLDAAGNIDIFGAYSGSSITTTGQGEFGNIVTSGTLEVGAVDSPQSVTIAGDLSVSGNSTVAGTASFANNQVTINSNAGIGCGAISCSGVSGGVTQSDDDATVLVFRAFDSDGDTFTVAANGTTNIDGPLNVTQGDVNITKDADITGDLDVGGVLNTSHLNALGNLSVDGDITCDELTTNTSATLTGDQPLTIKTPLTDNTACIKFQNNSDVASGTVWKLLANGDSEQTGSAIFDANVNVKGTATIVTYDLDALPALSTAPVS